MIFITVCASVLLPQHIESLKILEQMIDKNKPRVEKSLLNTFPFNQHENEFNSNHNHQDHHEHHNDFEKNSIEGVDFTQLLSRQYGEIPEESPNKKCIPKIMLVEETEYDVVVTCDHSYDKRCHTSYSTSYEAVQEEECQEDFKKVCFIEMVVVAFNETQDVCKKPLVKDCDVEGEPVCRTEYQSECWTKQIAHQVEDDVADCKTVHQEMCRDEVIGYSTKKVCEDWPHEECEITKQKITKYTPMTGCEKVPIELCAPAGCGFKEGSEECQPITKTVVSEKPEETCTIEPQRTCKHVTKLIPQLTPKEECVDVPKEVCTRAKTNPRKVKKPVLKNWCYTPSEESGLS